MLSSCFSFQESIDRSARYRKHMQANASKCKHTSSKKPLKALVVGQRHLKHAPSKPWQRTQQPRARPSVGTEIVAGGTEECVGWLAVDTSTQHSTTLPTSNKRDTKMRLVTRLRARRHRCRGALGHSSCCCGCGRRLRGHQRGRRSSMKRRRPACNSEKALLKVPCKHVGHSLGKEGLRGFR